MTIPVVPVKSARVCRLPPLFATRPTSHRPSRLPQPCTRTRQHDGSDNALTARLPPPRLLVPFHALASAPNSRRRSLSTASALSALPLALLLLLLVPKPVSRIVLVNTARPTAHPTIRPRPSLPLLPLPPRPACPAPSSRHIRLRDLLRPRGPQSRLPRIAAYDAPGRRRGRWPRPPRLDGQCAPLAPREWDHGGVPGAVPPRDVCVSCYEEGERVVGEEGGEGGGVEEEGGGGVSTAEADGGSWWGGGELGPYAASNGG